MTVGCTREGGKAGGGIKSLDGAAALGAVVNVDAEARALVAAVVVGLGSEGEGKWLVIYG